MNSYRFHVHLHVADLDANLRHYTQLFGAEPVVRKPDYAKWLLDDPRLNFAISSGKGDGTGIDHLGLQAETPGALAAVDARLRAIDAVELAETGAVCCYARSDKVWSTDPQGVRWEGFLTHGAAPTRDAPAATPPVTRCCGPDARCATMDNAGHAAASATACC